MKQVEVKVEIRIEECIVQKLGCDLSNGIGSSENFFLQALEFDSFNR